MFISESLTQCLRLSRIAPSPLAKCNPCVTLPKLRLLRRIATGLSIAFILRSLTKYLSNRVNIVYNSRNRRNVARLEFADRDSMNSDPIDIIISADPFGMLVFFNGVRKSSKHELTMQNITFSWILSGPIASFPITKSISELAHHGVVLETLDCEWNFVASGKLRKCLRKFLRKSLEEHHWEEHFSATHSRTLKRHYIRLSFKNELFISIGELHSIAVSSFHRLI